MNLNFISYRFEVWFQVMIKFDNSALIANRITIVWSRENGNTLSVHSQGT